MSASRSSTRGAVAVGLTVVAAMLALQVGWGAPLGDVLLYLGYEVCYRVLPGLLLFLVLSSRPGGPLKQIAIGWALGAALETIAFMVTAALDVRDLYAFYPLLVAIPALLVLRRQGVRGEAEPPMSQRTCWALGAVAVAAMFLLALVSFPSAPHPGGGDSFTYFIDYPWHLGLAGEALHHWPILDPNIAGEPFPYHYFVHIHMAAASQVTGVELPVVFFRLYALPLALLSVLLFATAGRSLSGSVRVGLVAACLAFFVGDLQLQTSSDFVPHAPFLGVFFSLVVTSPSFLYGLTAFLALVVTIGERVVDRERGSWGDWVVVGCLVFLATGAKVSILPLIAVSLGLLGAWILVSERRLASPVLIAGGLTAAIGGITFLSQYKGQASGLTIDPFETFKQMPAIGSMKGYLLAELPEFPLRSAIVGIVAVAIGLLGMLSAQLAGVGWFAWRPRLRPRLEVIWLTSLLAGGFLALFFLLSPGAGNQLYFVYYGVMAGCLLAAIGLRRAWRARPRTVDRPRVLIGIAAGWILALVLLMRVPFELFTGADALAETYLLWYGGLIVGVLILVLVTRRLLPSPWWAAAAVTVALVGIGAMGSVSNYLVPGLSGRERDERAPTALTSEAYEGFSWIRENTPTDAVFAVNSSDPFYFDVAAFAERRTFLEGYVYSRASFAAGYDQVIAGSVDLFPDRKALNAAAFAGDPAALRTLADDYGVEYLIVDSRGQIEADVGELSRSTALVYENRDLKVFKLEELP